jgi:hypothetical protein
VLERVNGSSSLAVSLYSATELLEGRIDASATNGVHWGTRSALAANLSHFPELGTEPELLGSGCSTDLTEVQVDALWTKVHPASNLLASYIPLSVARGPSNGIV